MNYNAIGYNVLDNYIYGIDNGGVASLIRIDENGDITDLGVPPGFVDDGYNIGAMDESGNLYVVGSTDKQTLHVIDVAAVAVTTVPIVNALMDPRSNLVADFSYNRRDGLLYGAWAFGIFGSGVQTIDPVSGLRELKVFAAGSPGAAGGVTWLNAAGTLFVNGGTRVTRIDSHEAAKTIEGYGVYPGDRSPFSANAFRVKLLPLASPPIAGWGAKSKPRSIHKHKASRL